MGDLLLLLLLWGRQTDEIIIQNRQSLYRSASSP